MPLNAVVEDINTVDESLRDHYKEDNGKFVLQVAPVGGFKLENVDGLTSALGAERNLKKSLEDKLKTFDGIDPNLARQAIARVAEFGDLTPEQAKEAKETAERLLALDPKKDAERIAAERIDQVTKQLQGEFTSRETQLKDALTASANVADALKTQLKTLLVDNQIKGSLASLNPLDDARDAIQILAERHIRSDEKDGTFVVEVIDDAGNPRVKVENGSVVPFTVEDLLAEIKEKRPGLFKAESKSGAGLSPTTGSSGGNTPQVNPWMADSLNRTQQALITKQNPELAKRLKAQAGVA